VWSDKVVKYKSMLVEGMCYEIRNTSICKKNYEFKQTSHEYILFFKNMFSVKSIDDSTVPFYAFKFTSFDEIFNAKNEDL
jgi:hypothetical protein